MNVQNNYTHTIQNIMSAMTVKAIDCWKEKVLIFK